MGVGVAGGAAGAGVGPGGDDRRADRDGGRAGRADRRPGAAAGAELAELLAPSSDALDTPPRSLRKKTGRRPGKQPGSPGAALRRVDDPDEVVEHVPSSCTGCGVDLAEAAAAGVVRRQVHDIPDVTIRVVEHRLHRRRCGCGCVTVAQPPAGVSAPVADGPNRRALAVYLVVFQHVPVERAATLIADVTGAGCSTGWVSGVLAATAEALADVEKLIKTLVVLAQLVHVDETSLNVGGGKQWLHVACTRTLTAYHLHSSRGRAAVEQFGVLPGFTGTAVHDALSVYDGYPGATHALCGAHIARELVAAAETHPDRDWPTAALDALFGLNDAAHASRERGLRRIPAQTLDPLLDRWRHAILCGLSTHPRRDGRKQSTTRNLLERLRDRDQQVLRFARDPATVPFSNNQAERPAPGQDPDQDLRLPPQRHRRPRLAPRPRLHLHRPQEPHQCSRCAARRHHRHPLDATPPGRHLNGYAPSPSRT